MTIGLFFLVVGNKEMGVFQNLRQKKSNKSLISKYNCEFLKEEFIEHEEALEILAEKVIENKAWINIQDDVDLKFFARRWSGGKSGYPKLTVAELKEIFN